MISFGGHLLLYVFIGFGLLLSIVSVVHLYHALRYGRHDPLMVAMTGFYLAGIIIIVWITVGLLSAVDWSQPFQLSIPDIQFGAPKF